MNNDSGIKDDFLEEIQRISMENNVIFYRLEIDSPIIHNSKFLIHQSFVKSFEQMQPENTWILDITEDENSLLYGMIRSCRYNIGLAKKSGIMITKGLDQKLLDNFYELYSVTSKRHGITYRDRSYFEALLGALSKDGHVRIYNGSIQKDGAKALLSAGILIFSGKKAIYMFGASSNEYRNLKAPYLLVWQMMLDAKEQGCTEFDFYGIAPTDDPEHPWAGITSFKKQFGGRKIDIWGSYDLIFKPLEYQLFKIAEKIRRH